MTAATPSRTGCHCATQATVDLQRHLVPAVIAPHKLLWICNAISYRLSLRHTSYCGSATPSRTGCHRATQATVDLQRHLVPAAIAPHKLLWIC